ncbi:hypothetical protein J4573_30030 [Actinomadura barringtoniae]|uniref:Uncharacterized protein n=1 Tax=Actinomadura barringtoniae TaxID=1427535 RepID=A0A939PFJ2_9ACTN|nr:hypothetical protein [Actinomadura barringtoniae]MBO2451363.1 hypothetical protein [Actinomadura barringtoniae]
MSVSIYYTAIRAQSLTEAEQATIAALIANHDPDRFADSGESFCVYDNPQPGEVFAGSTALPLSEEAAEALFHWTDLLSAIRRALPDAEWNVHVEDQDLPWDEGQQAYTME